MSFDAIYASAKSSKAYCMFSTTQLIGEIPNFFLLLNQKKFKIQTSIIQNHMCKATAYQSLLKVFLNPFALFGVLKCFLKA